jgi:general secretion pathway protein D
MTRQVKTASCRICALLPMLFLVTGPCHSLRAGPANQASLSSVEAQAEFEIAQRRALAAEFAPQAMQRGTEALAIRDYETAFSEYRAALDAIPDAPEVRELHDVALDGFTKAAMGLADQRIAEGRWEDAQTTVECLLLPEYNPDYQPALRLLQRLQSPDYFNKTVTPGFVSRVEKVKKLLLDGQGFYDSGRFDQAMRTYEEVLQIDRFNIAARRGMEQVDLARTRVAEAAYNDTRASMITDVDKGWELPVKRSDSGPNAILEQPVMNARGTQSINSKLDDIVIPRISFTDATLREVIGSIREQAARLDAGSDEDPGVNIVLKLDEAAASQEITIDLSNLPLREALDYVTRLAGLKIKVEPYAVLIVPVTEETEVLLTKEYRVPPGFITNLPSGSEGAPTTDGSVAVSKAKEFLESQGVEFPTGASANFLPSSSRLIVRNTQENLDLVDALVESSAETAPSQVEIESKFVEVSQDNLKELGFDWLLGQFAFPGGSGVYGGGGTTGDQFNAVSPPAGQGPYYPFRYPGTTVPVGVNPITAGNRTGTAGITANAVDAILLGNPVTGPASGVLALAGVFTNPQFQVVLRALNQKKGIDVLSAPKVTTKSGSQATVEIVREFRYPEEYDPPQVPQQTGGGGSQVVTPATPTTFTMQPVGVRLEVEPTVGPDNYTIDLRLLPEVTEFEGFINYGTPILNQGVEVTPNVINYPVFSQRKVETQVHIYDGQTVALGGLIREDVQKVTDKTPLLGDIPFAGVLFRSQADKHIKRNLIVFVTASLRDPAGQPIAASADLAAAGEDLEFPALTPPSDDALEPPLP